jgi:alkanesulfonate monooxygenase SsuD/methylene tetrahydromethanopterin reductase-like flavin-dependent oxidoreductase (luciferase family)
VTEFIFGVNVPTSAADGADPVEDARFAERVGFDFISSSDHPGSTSPNFETWTMLTWIAALTSKIHLAPRVLGVPLRSPAMVAKMSESLDRLSGGRLILGMGAGGSEQELRSLGASFASPKERFDGLEDALSIVRGLWREPAFTHTGAAYSTEAAELEPKPARRIPIWLGTFRSRGLAMTGRLADGWIPTLGYASAEELPAMRERVLAGARDAGRHPDDIRCVLNIEIGVTGYCNPDPEMVTGTADEIADQLGSYAAMGFTGFNMIPTGNAIREQLELIAGEVIPAVRAGG